MIHMIHITTYVINQLKFGNDIVNYGRQVTHRIVTR